VKISLNIALNAARLPKFETVNGKSWSPAFGSLVGQWPEIGGALSCQRMLAFLYKRSPKNKTGVKD